MDALFQDLRYALRQLARSPGFTAVAILTLAIGIGANTALFTLVNSVFLKPLPGVHDDGRLVWIAPVNRRGRQTQMPYRDFIDYRSGSPFFARATAFGNVDVSIAVGDEPVRARGQIVTSNYLSVLGTQLQVGRGFSPEDDSPGNPPVVVISDRLWRERFGAEPSAVGRVMSVDGRPFTIVGVAPPKFLGADFADRARDIWVSMSAQPIVAPDLEINTRHSWWLSVVARLDAGISLDQARGAAQTIAQRIAATDRGHEHISVTVTPARGGLRPSDAAQVAPIGFLAAAATGLILLICCANVGNMLVARAVRRRHEIAVRLSIGATRRRLIRQLLTESVLLALAASGAGLIAARWATDALTTTILPTADVSLDWRTGTFAIIAAIATGLTFGILPAFSATRANLGASLRDGIALVSRRSRLQGALVIAQIALSLVLLVTSGMFLGGLYRAANLQLGYDPSPRVLGVSFDFGMQGYTPEQVTTFLSELSQRARVFPTVSSVSASSVIPLGNRFAGTDATLDPSETDHAATEFGQNESVGLTIVRPAYFRTVGIELVAGRDFSMDDRASSQSVIIVSEDFARRAWPSANPLGKHVKVSGNDAAAAVIGVARAAQTSRIDQAPRPTVYRAQLQSPREREFSILIRSTANASDLAPSIRAAVRAIDPNLPILEMQSLASYRDGRLSDLALGSTLLGLIGGTALLLASVGIFAVVAFAVGERTREIGLRVALGAAGRDVSALFLRDGLRLTLIGMAIGAVLGGFVAKAVAAKFLGVSVMSVSILVGVALLLAVVALVATWIPARRASLVDPMIALRSE